MTIGGFFSLVIATVALFHSFTVILDDFFFYVILWMVLIGAIVLLVGAGLLWMKLKVGIFLSLMGNVLSSVFALVPWLTYYYSDDFTLYLATLNFYLFINGMILFPFFFPLFRWAWDSLH